MPSSPAVLVSEAWGWAGHIVGSVRETLKKGSIQFQGSEEEQNVDEGCMGSDSASCSGSVTSVPGPQLSSSSHEEQVHCCGNIS